MTKEQWFDHIKTAGEHDRNTCPDCQARMKTRRANARAKAIRQVYADCGMVRVKGALGGIYYE